MKGLCRVRSSRRARKRAPLLILKEQLNTSTSAALFYTQDLSCFALFFLPDGQISTFGRLCLFQNHKVRVKISPLQFLSLKQKIQLFVYSQCYIPINNRLIIKRCLNIHLAEFYL